MVYITDTARWRALATRDANANGHFVYSVKTTNIYCRPTCPARLARRANVGFYKTPTEAEADGFRACKRCKPNSAPEDPQEKAVEKACAVIEEAVRNHDPKSLRLQDLAKNVGLTPRYFHKIFKDKTGMTPKEWAKARQASQSSADATPALGGSPSTSVEVDSTDWDLFHFSEFNELVDFDFDGSASLGYNLATGADQPVSMGHGNAIDVNILYDLWSSGYEPNGVEAGCVVANDSLLNTLGEVRAPALMRPSTGKPMPISSTFELDVDALLRCDNGLF
ncbi:metal binding domain of Ada-domain-containing protein [Paraphoma chrysanthemicola]|uniref:Metal binding domain of Ada-domain-containing protein n=1 Tax=Paraphoma chrysanthemicola TaxID=798071 RepID=A0A8K0R778_9PLEO|nr:metal binding domain of Ada-domain-containing protein [Paraphoma chrysanthemicola]